MKNLIKDLESLNRHDTLDKMDHELIKTAIDKLKSLEDGKKEYYFLFGEVACDTYHEGDFEALLKELAAGLEFSIHNFTEGQHPATLLEAADGWMGIAEITKEEYDQLLTIKEKED